MASGVKWTATREVKRGKDLCPFSADTKSKEKRMRKEALIRFRAEGKQRELPRYPENEEYQEWEGHRTLEDLQNNLQKAKSNLSGGQHSNFN